MIAKYVNKNMNGLTKKHNYELYFKKGSGRDYGYYCHIAYDLTSEEEIDKYLVYSSLISLKNNWEFEKLELDND